MRLVNVKERNKLTVAEKTDFKKKLDNFCPVVFTSSSFAGVYHFNSIEKEKGKIDSI